MYFIARLDAESHLWRQGFPNGNPEQITSGPADEEGLAVERDGNSVITSLGNHQSAIWIHDSTGDRPLSSEGEVVSGRSAPLFSADSKFIYALIRHPTAGSGQQLWRTIVAPGASGKTEAVLPGASITSFDLSLDGKQVVYDTSPATGKSQIWIAPIDGSSAPKRISKSGENSPHFGPNGRILFRQTEGNFNYLEQMNPDGSDHSKVATYPINEILGVSPGKRWVMAIIPFSDSHQVGIVAIPSAGGPPIRVCAGYCIPKWSPDGKHLFIPVEAASRTSPGRSIAIPVGSGEAIPPLPPGGIKPQSEAAVVPGARSVAVSDFIPGNEVNYFAYVNTTEHRNLFRVSLP
jgi:hypothetical protein